MNRLPFVLIFFLFAVPALVFGQSNGQKYDLSTIDGTIEALYASISGEQGVERDWDTFRSLFREDAKLMPIGFTRQKELAVFYWSVEDYIERAGPGLVENGFFEEEIHRITEQYEPLAHLFSTYTSRRTEEGEIFARGINSIQLFNDGDRWWITNISWVGESQGRKIPEKYLPE